MEFNVVEGVQKEPFTCFLYGIPGIGKSYLASKASRVIFGDTERGTGRLDAKRVVLDDFRKTLSFMTWATKQDEYDTVVIDSMTAFEKLVVGSVLADNNWQTLESPGYGRGHVVLKDYWRRFMNGIDYVKERGKNVIIVGHARVKPFNDPLQEGYDRYEPDVHKDVVAQLSASVDAVIFMRQRTILKDAADGDKRKIAVGEGAELFTADSPAFIAKNRFNLPNKILVPRVKDGDSLIDPLWHRMQ